MTPMEPSLHERFAQLHGGDDSAALACAKALGQAAAIAGQRVIAVSACLVGEPVRYDGGHKYAPEALAELPSDPSVVLMPLCPELLAGMGCPRPAVHFAEGDGIALADGRRGRICDVSGHDRTAEMVAGADRALALCEAAGVDAAILKENSPSCGLHQIHGPHGRQPGQGVFAARLARLGIPSQAERAEA